MAQLKPAFYALVCASTVWRKNLPTYGLLARRTLPTVLWGTRTISIDRDQEIARERRLKTMSRFTDQQFLKTDQYRDSSNLDARVVIHQHFSTNPYGWFTWVFDSLLKLPENARILELGCGPGLLWKENADRIPADWNITLSDLSPGMLDAALRNLVVTGRAFQFKEIDAQSIPFEDETLDTVLANHMLYHVPDRPKAIAEIKRILKPGGRLIATTVGENHMKETWQWFQRVHIGKIWESFANPFTLENGLEQLKPYFPHVNLSRYKDNLQ